MNLHLATYCATLCIGPNYIGGVKMSALLQSRKFWIGFLSVAAVFAAVFLRSMNLIPADALIPTITAITAAGVTGVSAIVVESVSADKAGR